MKGARAKRRAEAERLAAEIAAATAIRACERCGRRFRGQGAYEVAHDGLRCLADWTIESMLECRNGVWQWRGRA